METEDPQAGSCRNKRHEGTRASVCATFIVSLCLWYRCSFKSPYDKGRKDRLLFPLPLSLTLNWWNIGWWRFAPLDTRTSVTHRIYSASPLCPLYMFTSFILCHVIGLIRFPRYGSFSHLCAFALIRIGWWSCDVEFPGTGQMQVVDSRSWSCSDFSTTCTVALTRQNKLHREF